MLERGLIRAFTVVIRMIMMMMMMMKMMMIKIWSCSDKAVVPLIIGALGAISKKCHHLLINISPNNSEPYREPVS